MITTKSKGEESARTVAAGRGGLVTRGIREIRDLWYDFFHKPGGGFNPHPGRAPNPDISYSAKKLNEIITELNPDEAMAMLIDLAEEAKYPEQILAILKVLETYPYNNTDEVLLLLREIRSKEGWQNEYEIKHAMIDVLKTYPTIEALPLLKEIMRYSSRDSLRTFMRRIYSKDRIREIILILGRFVIEAQTEVNRVKALNILKKIAYDPNGVRWNFVDHYDNHDKERYNTILSTIDELHRKHPDTFPEFPPNLEEW